MLAIPVPYVAALMLSVLLARMALAPDRRDPFRPAMLFTGAAIVLLVLVGLRWQTDWLAVRILRPIMAMALPPLAWFAFAGGPVRGLRLLAHSAPVALMVAAVAFRRPIPVPVDALLALSFLGYGGALAWRLRRNADGIEGVRLEDSASARSAGLVAAAALGLSGLVDLAIALDLGFGEGLAAPMIVAAADSLLTVGAAVASATLDRASPAAEAAGAPDAATAEPRPAADAGVGEPDIPDGGVDDDAIVRALDEVIRNRRLFADTDLTLDRLARRSGVPARRISAAVNRSRGLNISQFLNDYRIAEACRLLDRTDLPVTAVMFDSGFLTKSNFNREFRRVTGMSPTDWRRREQSHADGPGR
ncbi:AraC family transcriptional regulator [Prosthecomicrobium hirschii]|uniref:helix-turn-helix domain-containing protein n=1 Tax=Prosthecodimorpha hirschii TaxID=665126 RepID=UPI001126777E|nr:AraC family transcriptional regulator [Prosthecomicrobium hirschii]TPQ49257.1 AraC family transcriptional regulator [Prosthecomicrobium hirschii]